MKRVNDESKMKFYKAYFWICIILLIVSFVGIKEEIEAGSGASSVFGTIAYICDIIMYSIILFEHKKRTKGVWICALIVNTIALANILIVLYIIIYAISELSGTDGFSLYLLLLFLQQLSRIVAGVYGLLVLLYFLRRKEMFGYSAPVAIHYSKIYCPACGNENSTEYSICKPCGEDLPVD